MDESFGDYTVNPHEISACRPAIELGRRRIKVYHLHSTARPANSSYFSSARGALTDRISSVESLSGLGFAVISPGVVNLTMWGVNSPPHDLPSLAHPTIYSVTQSKKQGMRLEKQQNIGKVGSYCFWEQEILHHEGRALRVFLKSGRTEEDLRIFLDSYLEGIIE